MSVSSLLFFWTTCFSRSNVLWRFLNYHCHSRSLQKRSRNSTSCFWRWRYLTSQSILAKRDVFILLCCFFISPISFFRKFSPAFKLIFLCFWLHACNKGET